MKGSVQELISGLQAQGATIDAEPSTSLPSVREPVESNRSEAVMARISNDLATINKAKSKALQNVLWVLFRPILIPMTFLLIFSTLCWAIGFSVSDPLGSHSAEPVSFVSLSLCLSASLLLTYALGGWGLSQDPIFQRSLGLEDSGVKAGIHYNPSSQRMERLLQRCSFYHKPYRRTPWLINGDWTTVIPTLLYKKKPVLFQRLILRLHGSATGAPIDVTVLPSHAAAINAHKPVLVLLAGVGGDSNAGYIRDLCFKAGRKGWRSLVILPRGVGSHLCSDCRDLFSPNDNDYLDQILKQVCTGAGSSPVILVGFSMGGIMWANYLSRYQAPMQVRGAVTISAAFKCDFQSWDRYVDVYQKLIVPSLISDVIGKYGAQLFELLGEEGFKELCASSRYSDLSPRIFSKIHPGSSANAEVWRKQGEGERFKQYVAVPFLLLTARDDPFHHPAMIGAEEFPSNPNIAYFVTPSGGHLGWPEGSLPCEFSFVNRVVTDFTESCLMESSPLGRNSTLSNVSVGPAMPRPPEYINYFVVISSAFLLQVFVMALLWLPEPFAKGFIGQISSSFAAVGVVSSSFVAMVIRDGWVKEAGVKSWFTDLADLPLERILRAQV